MVTFNYLLVFYSYPIFTEELIVEIKLALENMTFIELVGVYSWLFVFFILWLGLGFQIEKELKKINKR